VILRAEQIEPQHLPCGKHTSAQLRGLRYQRALGRALARTLKRIDATLIPEPWYRYVSHDACNICAPDFLVEKGDSAIVIEVKLTFVFSAIEKLTELYVPVVRKANPRLKRIVPLIVTKTLTPSAPPTIPRISKALDNVSGMVPVLQWRDRQSPLVW
jgi:hypothetical protein